MRLLASKAGNKITETAIPRVAMVKGEIPEHRLTAVYEPMINLILTGSKSMTVGDKTWQYNPATYFVMSVDLPAVGKVFADERTGAPYLAVSLTPKPEIIAELLDGMPGSGKTHLYNAGFSVAPVTSELLDAWLDVYKRQLLGGRAAEKLVFGELSTGAADDLARATDIARDMITRFGMDESLGYIAFEAQRPRFLNTPELASGGCRVAESTQARIDQAIRDIVMGVFERAYGILDANRAVLERCARELLARETLDEADIRRLTEGLQRATPATAAEAALPSSSTPSGAST